MIRGIVFPTQDIAALQGGSKLGLNIEIKKVPDDRAVDHPRGIQPVVAQGGDEGLGCQWPKGA